ncbi:MAG: zinc ribbon domain-containing protein [Anaerolineaceae bacterium]|nr:zinc ribbon domain-containing protein [Anaerolineaceae bacterium]
MKTWKWLVIVIAGMLVVFFAAAFLFGGMGRYWMPMHGRFAGFPGMGPRGLFGGGLMLGRGLLMLLLVALAAAGGTAIYNGLKKPAPPAAPHSVCPQCGKPVETTWSHCPYCGEKI